MYPSVELQITICIFYRKIDKKSVDQLFTIGLKVLKAERRFELARIDRNEKVQGNKMTLNLSKIRKKTSFQKREEFLFKSSLTNI